MINPKYNLTVLHDDNASFSDYTNIAADFLRDQITLVVTSATSIIYIGYEKPINSIYFDLDTVAASNTLTVEYYNGSAFTGLSDLHDDTKGFTRNGFVQWSRNQTTEAKTTINGIEKYWYKITTDTDISPVFNGINIVFNDLQDLRNEYEDVDLDVNDTPGISYFVNARNNIIQKLRNSGNKKTGLTGYVEMIGPYDLLNIHEVRQAAIFHCLSKWFFRKSDAPDDVWAQKSLYYNQEYIEALNLARISLDLDDDGLTDGGENQKVSATRKFSR